MFSNKLLFTFAVTCLLVCSVSIFAKTARGTESGGGGDATELRVNEIRSDLLTWINNGGAKNLVLPDDVSYGEYESKMVSILQPQIVIIGFVEKDSSDDEELQVIVHGIPKTCRGFISSKDSSPHILCNISRFKNTSESEQYKLIHHEYAGIVNIEKNNGASSDYAISSQITDFLKTQKILKLAIKKKDKVELSTSCLRGLNEVIDQKKKNLKSIESGEGSNLLSMSENTANTTALMCAGLKKLELEKSFMGRLGLISQDKADEAGEETYRIAIEYYNAQIAGPADAK